MVFPVVMCRCESWSIKKAEHQRIDAFELCCWRRLLRVPWTTRRSNQSILKEFSPELIGSTDVEAETPILWPSDMKSWLIEKDSDAGKRWGKEKKGMTRWDSSMASLTQWTCVWVDSRSWWWKRRPGMLQFMGLQSQTWLSNWTELIGWILF